MSAAEFERFDSDVMRDPNLYAQLTQHPRTFADIVAFAAERGYAFTDDEVKDYVNATRAAELSDKQLDLVAGGAGTPSRSWGLVVGTL
jgi:predicted ribosomally synthesized peptide with nif11-like leader